MMVILLKFFLAEIGSSSQKHVFYYISGPHKQYIQVDTIFNYRFHSKSSQNIHFLAAAVARKVCFPDFPKDVFLEVRHLQLRRLIYLQGESYFFSLQK